MAKKKDKNKSIRNVELENADIATLATFALTSKNSSFKKYAEKILSERAAQIRKNQTQLLE